MPTAPAESLLLKAAYKKSGLTVADIAAATGLSVATLHIALNGIRYRDGSPRVAVPSDITIVKVASVLGMDPQIFRGIGRDRAADLMVEAANAKPTSGATSEQEAIAAATAHAALASRVLSVFSTDELIAELRRREARER